MLQPPMLQLHSSSGQLETPRNVITGSLKAVGILLHASVPLHCGQVCVQARLNSGVQKLLALFDYLYSRKTHDVNSKILHTVTVHENIKAQKSLFFVPQGVKLKLSVT